MSFLTKVCDALTAEKLRFAVVGGHAVALHGAVRGTVDIDIAMVWQAKNLALAEQVLSRINLKSRLPLTARDVYDYRDEYVKNRNLVAWNFYNPDDLSEQLDIIITYDLKGKRVQKMQVANSTIPVLHIDDLIAMKKDSGRPQDIEDAKALEYLR